VKDSSTESKTSLDESGSVWTVARIRAPSNRKDEVVQILWELDTLGIEEQEAEGPLLLTYFRVEVSPEALRLRLQESFTERGIEPVSVRTGNYRADPAEWIRSYRASFRGFPLGRRFFLHPSWEAPSADGRIPIQLDPGHAFGTGTHESTRLCIEMLEDLLPGPEGMLDVGTGSGILSIAARKLAPALRACALDNDFQAINAARENFQVNREEEILLVCGSVDAVSGAFPLIVANLTSAIISELADRLCDLASRQLVISGVTSEQSDQVVEWFEAGRSLRCLERRSLNGWECLRFSNSREDGTREST
jgi:ribosomal protein L11 methyltransferase